MVRSPPYVTCPTNDVARLVRNDEESLVLCDRASKPAGEEDAVQNVHLARIGHRSDRKLALSAISMSRCQLSPSGPDLQRGYELGLLINVQVRIGGTGEEVLLVKRRQLLAEARV